MKRDHSQLIGSVDLLETNKKAHVESKPVVNATFISQGHMIETMRAMQARIEALETQLQTERRLAYQTMHNQQQAFLEWQYTIERAYGGVDSSLRAVK